MGTSTKPFKSILVPIDVAHPASELIRWGSKLKEITGAKLTFMTVANHLPDVEELKRLSRGEGIQGRIMARLSALFEEQLKGMRLKAERAVRFGNPVTEILDYASKSGVDLIVVGSHHKTGLTAMLGSVSDGVARKARCPVLIVKGPAKKTKKIGVSVDGNSPGAKRALQVGATLVKLFDARLLPISLLEEVSLMPAISGDISLPVEGLVEDSGFREERMKARAKIVGKMVASLRGLKIMEPIVRFSLSLTDDLLTQIKRQKVDLFVMSAHREKGMHWSLMGRVARAVTHQAAASVLVIHEKDRKFRLI